MNETASRKAAREASNAYKREWAKRNPDKVKAAQERYWVKKAKEREEAANADNGETRA